MSIIEELRSRRNPRLKQTGNVSVNCDRHGYGDTIVAAWIAESSKNLDRKLVLAASGTYKELLECLGQSPVAPDASMYRLPISRGHADTPPRVYAWADYFGITLTTLSSPPLTIRNNSIEDGRRLATGRILLCPNTRHTNREWPRAYWLELYGLLNLPGQKVSFLGDENDYPNMIACSKWDEMFGMITASRLVIGVDSAPVHLAGTVGVPAIALTGMTTDGCFAHLPSVKCLAAERREIPCVGCWMTWQYTKTCSFGCVAMSHIEPLRVLREVINELDQT